MMQKDLFSDIHVKPCIAPVVLTDNTAAVGAIISHADYHSLTYLINTGTLSDADTTLTILLEHGDVSNLSDAAAVPDEDLLGTEAGAAITFADDGETRKLGYKGSKKYSRLTITPANNSGNIPIGAVAVLGHPRKGAITSQVN